MRIRPHSWIQQILIISQSKDYCKPLSRHLPLSCSVLPLPAPKDGCTSPPNGQPNSKTREGMTCSGCIALGARTTALMGSGYCLLPVGKVRRLIPRWWEVLRQKSINFLCERPDDKYCRTCWPYRVSSITTTQEDHFNIKAATGVTNETYMNKQGWVLIKLFMNTKIWISHAYHEIVFFF